MFARTTRQVTRATIKLGRSEVAEVRFTASPKQVHCTSPGRQKFQVTTLADGTYVSQATLDGHRVRFFERSTPEAVFADTVKHLWAA